MSVRVRHVPSCAPGKLRYAAYVSGERRDQRLVRGVETRQRILARAVDLASVSGLDGLSIGDLASDLGMSKAGVFAHFGSKEELQLATINAAREIYILKNAARVFTATPGIVRVWTLCESLLDYLASDTFRGGCFFWAVSAEYDDRPGPVRDRLVEVMREWSNILVSVIGEAKSTGDLQESSDPAQLAFELLALQAGANWARRLLADDKAIGQAKHAMTASLEAIATPQGKRALKPLL